MCIYICLVEYIPLSIGNCLGSLNLVMKDHSSVLSLKLLIQQTKVSLSICWVDERYEIHEDFIGFVHVPDITANTLTSYSCLL